MELVLSPWAKVATMGVAALLVVLVLLIAVCFVGPGCWGYEWLNADEERERRRRRLMTMAIGGDIVKLSTFKRMDDSCYNTGVSGGSTSSLFGRMEVHRDSTYSSMSDTTERSSFRSTAPSVTSSKSSTTAPATSQQPTALGCATEALQMDKVLAEKAAAAAAAAPRDRSGSGNGNGPPQLHMTLQFLGGEDGAGQGRLVIGIQGASSLPPRAYVGGLEPFVAVVVRRSTWPLHRRAGPPLHCMRTRALRHTRDPRFQQAFQLDVKRSDVKDWVLRVTAFDQDRHGNPTELCFVDVSLRDVKSLLRGEEAVLDLPLQISDKEVGEVLVGLSFLPTAQRLSVSVLRAARLRFLEVTQSLADFQPYVRVVQLSGSSGRAVRRKKTSPRAASDAPEFNETLTFDVSTAQLESAVFLVLLCTKSPGPPTTPTPTTPSAPLDKTPNGLGLEEERRPYRDRCLGKVALGRCVGSRYARHHWMAVMQSPRSVHSAWHPLK